ncbi:MAG: VOC family protein [Anaerolineae bacterium]|nr:VOC family protein [Anaerolineae bacterium]
MKFKFFSIFVDDQAKALAFYTEKLGFYKQADLPVGEYRFLTISDTEDPRGVQVMLEPDEHPVAQSFKQGLYAAGLPVVAFDVEDIHAEVEQLKARGVTIVQEPTDIGPAILAVLDDTCGNLIQLAQGKASE